MNNVVALPPPAPKVKVAPRRPAHVQAVLEECAELWTRARALAQFLITPEFTALDDEERDRQVRQLVFMRAYGDVLNERIEAFKP